MSSNPAPVDRTSATAISAMTSVRGSAPGRYRTCARLWAVRTPVCGPWSRAARGEPTGERGQQRRAERERQHPAVDPNHLEAWDTSSGGEREQRRHGPVGDEQAGDTSGQGEERALASSCRTRRDRVAPRATRTASSRRRCDPRASNRCATLAHATSRTKITAPAKIDSGRRRCPPTAL